MAAVARISEETAWQATFVSGLQFQYEAGRLTSREFFEHFCRATGARPDYDSLLRAACDIFELNTAIVPLVMHLRQANYRLGILSNTNEAHWQWVSTGRYALVRDFFPIAALSFEVRVMKPDAAIYAAAATQAGVAPHEIFYADDRPENVAGACAAGFDAVLFENPRQLAAELNRRHVRWNY
jgi:putative hydrolase of the HAD superfamily